MRPLPTVLVALATGALAATLVPAPATAAATTTLNPAKLPRGADVAIPHLEGKTVVDGSVRIRIKAPALRLLGKSGTSYVVGTADRQGAHGQFFRVAPDGTRTKLGRGDIYLTELAGDGQNLVSTKVPSNSTSVVTIRSATTGDTVASRRFKGYASALDGDTGRVLVGGPRKTWVWTTGTDSVAVVARYSGYAGDLSADVVAGYTKDPYRGGCTVVRRISTGEQLWKSCKERVAEFNADGSRMATIDILSDGIGPGWVGVRGSTGHKFGAYTVNGWFGSIDFETTTAVLLETNGARKTATVRCTDAGCERASDLSATVQPRAS
jgi:hypothetical protein